MTTSVSPRHALADALLDRPSGDMLIGGETVAAEVGATYDDSSPADGRVLGMIACAPAEGARLVCGGGGGTDSEEGIEELYGFTEPTTMAIAPLGVRR